MDEEAKTNEVALPVIEEELVTGRRKVKTGSVRVRKEVERIRKPVRIPLVKDVVRVERVPINRVVQDVPEIHEDGAVLIIPVVEEEIEVRRRLVLKEEIHIVREKVQENATTEVTLAREHAVVERLDARDKVIERSGPLDDGESPSTEN